MSARPAARRLIVNADDFGLTRARATVERLGIRLCHFGALDATE